MEIKRFQNLNAHPLENIAAVVASDFQYAKLN